MHAVPKVQKEALVKSRLIFQIFSYMYLFIHFCKRVISDRHSLTYLCYLQLSLMQINIYHIHGIFSFSWYFICKFLSSYIINFSRLNYWKLKYEILMVWIFLSFLWHVLWNCLPEGWFFFQKHIKMLSCPI
jgi:hypothetical protein